MPLSNRDLSPATLLLIGLCALVYLLDGLSHSILGPLAPAMARTLHLSNAQLGPIFSANLLGQCIGLVLLPMFAGRAGQRGVVLICLAGFGLAQTGSALANDATALFVWRLVTGVFLGGCLPSCLALVTAAAPEKRRGLAIMMLFIGYGIGATIAGLVANAFADFGGWRAAMVAVGIACLATVAISAIWLREIHDTESDDGDAAVMSQGARVLVLFSPGYLLGTLMLWMLFICMLTISYCLNSWLPTLLVEVGRNERFAALSVSVFSLGGILAALGVGVLIDRFGAGKTLISFLTISIALLFVIGRVLATASESLLLLLLVGCGFFVLGAYGGVNVVLATFYPARLRALGIGWAKSAGRLGTVIAPVLIGAGLSAGMEGTKVMSLFALPALLSVVSLAVITIGGRERSR